MVKISFNVVKLEPHNYHIIVKGKVANVPVNLVIDTGASHTCFDTEFVKSLNQNVLIEENEGLNVGVGSAGFDCKLSKIYQLKIGRFALPPYEIVLLDMQHINQAYLAVHKPIVHGIIGCDFFVKYKAVIDFNNHYLFLNV